MNYLKIYKTILILLFHVVSINSFSQFKIINSSYNTFDGRKIPVYLIEGKYSIINIDKNKINSNQLNDTLTLNKIINRVDGLYNFYKTNLGFEPSGGNVNYGNKVDVFFGDPSCGSGCGRIGAKGIECSGFDNIFFNIKYNTNVNRDVIIGYEFGRNFFNFSNKILFPYKPNTDERNGGFAEGFASFFYTHAFDEIITNQDERLFNETLLNIDWGKDRFFGYINDTIANPYNVWAKNEIKGIRDANRGNDAGNNDETSWPSIAVLEGLNQVFGFKNIFPTFFKELVKLPDVVSIEDALSNIALASSKSLNYNLNPFFKNVMKFKINKNVEDEIEKLPKCPNKLIKYEDTLYFITPFDNIRINLRSLNHKSEDLNYRIYLNKILYSDSKSGNNEIPYSILSNKNDVSIICKLEDNNSIVLDSFSIKLKKRNNINLLEDKKKWYSYYLSNLATKSYIENNNYVLKNLNDTLSDNGLLYFNYHVRKNRLLEISGNVKNFSKIPFDNNKVVNFSVIGYHSSRRSSGASRRVGYDIGKNDSTNYYFISGKDSTQLFFDTTNNDLGMIKIALENGGTGLKSYFKDIYVNDITDSDNDGVIDFDDICNFGKNSIKPVFNTSNFNICKGDTLKLSINNLKQNEKLIWFYNNKIDSTNKSVLNITDSTNVYVFRKDSIGCSRYSDTIRIQVLNRPSPPIISRDTDNNLAANTNGINWYKDGIVITDTTQRFKPITPGSYTAKTTQNGCVSTMSSPYFYLVTDIINLSKDEYIKIAPNPFQSQINFDFVINGYQRLNIDMYELSTGNRVKSVIGLTQGSKVDLGGLSSGTYVIRVSSLDNKISHQFKMVKL
jgi:hypothetical protein